MKQFETHQKLNKVELIKPTTNQMFVVLMSLERKTQKLGTSEFLKTKTKPNLAYVLLASGPLKGTKPKIIKKILVGSGCSTAVERAPPEQTIYRTGPSSGAWFWNS